MKNRKNVVRFAVVIFFVALMAGGYKMICRGNQCNSGSRHYNLESISHLTNVVPMIVIGSGAAGCQAAVYGAREHVRTIVIAGEKPGGQLMETTRVENWPGKRNVTGPEIMQDAKAQAQACGAEFLNASIEKVDFNVWPFKLWTDEGKEINALSVVIATGAKPRFLNIPGEQQYWGDGVTSCAVCDAPFFQDRKVVVIGGGDSAIEEATVLASYARKVTVLVRKDKMKAAASMQARLDKLSNIEVLFNREPKEIIGNGDNVTGIQILNNKTGEVTILAVEGVFLATGHDPNTAIFKSFIKLDQGYVLLEPGTHQTSVPGVYAAGDVADKRYKQAGKAAGDGSAAALDALEFLREIGFNHEISRTIDVGDFDLFDGQMAPVEELSSVQEFEEQVLKSSIPVAIDFGASWCASCPAMRQAFDAVSYKLVGRVKFMAVNIDQAVDLIKDARVHVRKVPCLLIYKNGQLAARHYDPMNKKDMYNYIVQFVG